MNMKQVVIKFVVGLAALLVLGTYTPAAHAVTIVTIGEQIVNGTFTTNLTGWSTTGTVNQRSSADTLNTSTGNNGFDSFFGSGFAALGSDTGSTISGTPQSGTDTLYQSFSLPTVVNGKSVISYDLMISFTGAFDGDDTTGDGGTTNKDLFSATLDLSSLVSQFSTPLPTCGPANSPTCSNSQVQYNPFTTTLTGLGSGSHTLTFRLNETSASGAGNTTNTAAGIDGVSIIAKATIPDDVQGPPEGTVPEPTSLLLMGSGLFGFLGFGITRKRV